MKHSRLSFLTALALLSLAPIAHAGPPFITDDPEPVEYKHWEINIGTMDFRDSPGDWSGLGPLFEVNYGVLPDVQLHIIAPFAYDKPKDEHGHYGYGDTELGIKYRFVHEDEEGWRPQIGVFPLVEVPTGNHDLGLGNGKAQLFVPVWLQKSIGKWTTYGGGGYWFNPGDEGNRDYWLVGWELQRKITENFSLGAEIYHTSPDTRGGSSSTTVNLGAIWEITEHHHILISAGHSVQGPAEFSGYFAYQLTFGPEEKKEMAPAK